MTATRLARIALTSLVLAVLLAGLVHAQGGRASTWTPPKTPWGHPDIEGTYTNKDEANTPLERPDQFQGRSATEFSSSDLAALAKERQAVAAKIAGGIGGAETGAGPTHWYEHLQGNGSRPWLIVDPADGKLPAMTPQGAKREAAWAALHNARNGEGRADSWLDRSLYDRCITRGLPGSMMPAIYGNAYEIVQTPESIAIRYEMIHETRVIPVDGRPHISQGIRQYLGDPRGHWEGDTLVVEVTNFSDKTDFRGSRETLRLVERFTRVRSDTISYTVTIDDASTFTTPWTIGVPLKSDKGQTELFEYACHEGNYAMRNILSGARAADKK